MKVRIFVSWLLAAFMISGLHAPVNIAYGFITEDPYNQTPINIPLFIHLNLWGFGINSAEIANEIIKSLPAQMIHEQPFNEDINSSVHYLNVNNWFFYYNYVIEYSFTIDPLGPLSSDLISTNITSLSESGTDIGQYIDQDNEISLQSGIRIPVQVMDNFLQPFNQNYPTINLLNLNQLDNTVTNGSRHWYWKGQTKSISESSYDFRSAGFVGENGMFYDSTAFTPIFDNETVSQTQPTPAFIIPRLSEFIEKIIIQPKQISSNQLPVFSNIHVSQILFEGENEDLVTSARINRAFNQFIISVNNLLPMLNIESNKLTVDLKNSPVYSDFLESNTELIDGKPAVILTQSNVENLKYLLRTDTSLYSSFPSRFYYTMLIFADSSNRTFLYEVNGKYKPYSSGFTGVSLLNINEWENELFFTEMLRQQLKIFGQMFGYTNTISGIASQFETVFSEYGITQSWDKLYSPFDRYSINIRYGVTFNTTANTILRNYAGALDDWKYDWTNSSLLDVAFTTLRFGDIAFHSKNYLQAAEFYILGYQQTVDAIKNIDDQITILKNTVIFIVLMSMFWYIIQVIFDSTIDIKKFRKQHNKLN